MALDYFTEAQVRAMRDIGEQPTFSTAKITAAGEWIQDIVERVCGTSFVPREVVETLDGTGSTLLRLKRAYVLSITEVTINGVESTDEHLVDAGVVEYRTAGTYGEGKVWPKGRKNIVVMYDAGFSEEPPKDLVGAMLDATRYRLLSLEAQSGLTDRAESITNEFGNVNLSTPDSKDHPTGLPEVDAIIADYARRTNTVVFP